MYMKIGELKPKIGICYIDMDGVICWMDKAIAEYNNISLETQNAAGFNNQYWKKVLAEADIYNLFVNLEWEPNGKNLIKWFEDRKLPIAFLTRPVREPNTEACIAGKKEWIKKHGLEHIPVIFEFDKEKYAKTSTGKTNILIDDHSGNTQKWKDAGGIEIHYRDAWFRQVINKLKCLYGERDEN